MYKAYLKLYYFFLIFITVVSPAGQAYGEIELDLFPNTFDKFSVDGQFHVFFRHDSNPSFSGLYGYCIVGIFLLDAARSSWNF